MPFLSKRNGSFLLTIYAIQRNRNQPIIPEGETKKRTSIICKNRDQSITSEGETKKRTSITCKSLFFFRRSFKQFFL